jgi:hypothetical protein
VDAGFHVDFRGLLNWSILIETTSGGIMNDKSKAVLLILLFGFVCPLILYVSGLRFLGKVGFGLIPLFVVCWGLSYLMTGSRERELWANVTDEERERLKEMVRAYGRSIPFRIVPVVAIAIAVQFGLIYFNSNDPWGYLMQNQLLAAGIMLGAIVVGTLINLPAMIRQRRQINEFLLQTDYARRQRESP